LTQFKPELSATAANSPKGKTKAWTEGMAAAAVDATGTATATGM
jgi:hypothetical protein